jgi:hypothetical protein
MREQMTKLNTAKIIEAVKQTHRALSAINPKYAMEAAELHQEIIKSARKL